MRNNALFIILAMVLAASGCQSMEMVPAPEGPGHPGGDFTQHYKYSHFGTTQNAEFSVELVFKEGTLQEGLNEMDIIIHDKDNRDVTGANVSMTPWMPRMNHGSNTVPMVMERGGGTYSARKVDITMPGLWQLKVRVSTVSANDEAVFEFMIAPSGEMMDMMQTPHTSPDMGMGMDMGKTKVVSARQLFNVSYETDGHIPMNSIHSWRLQVNNNRRMAVTGATIKVSGGMPAHGHGLPTRPIVTESDTPGVYHIDGMKFTMPGEWVVRLNIDTGLEQDTAEFFLLVQ